MFEGGRIFPKTGSGRIMSIRNIDMRWTISGPFELRRLLLALCLFFASAVPGLSAEFHLDLPVASGLQTDFERVNSALAGARRHRQEAPADTVVIDLPSSLVLQAPIVLGPQDAGRPSAPLVLRGSSPRGTTISGAVILPSQPLYEISTAVPGLISANTRALIRFAALGDFAQRLHPAMAARGSFSNGPSGRLALFIGEQRIFPSRWPADSYATHPNVTVDTSTKVAALTIAKDTPVEIAKEENLWIAGYWAWNWWYETSRVSDIGPRAVHFSMPASGFKSGARYYFMNLASELDRPETFYFDEKTNNIFFHPPNAGDKINAALSVATAEGLLRIVESSNIKIENVAFEKTFGTTILIQKASDVVLRDCFVGHTGGTAIAIDGGYRVTVERCVVSDVGDSGIAISGGDRNALAPANHTIRDTLVTKFGRDMPTYRPGIALEGVNNSVEGCEISDGPHTAISFRGNDNRIFGNIIHNVVLDTGDTGAIYSGRNWTIRGNVIASNYIYDIRNRVDNSDAVGVYLDDQLSGTRISGNVFERVDLPILIGGGRDNIVENNLSLAAKHHAIWLDARGLSWQKEMVAGILRQELDKTPYQVPPWSLRYPELVNILNDRPGAPINNTFSDNIAVGGPLLKYDSPKTMELANRKDSVEMRSTLTGRFPDVLDELPAGPAKVSLSIDTYRMFIRTRSTMDQLRQRWAAKL